MSELVNRSAAQLGADISAGKVSSQEALATFVQRQETLDGPLNAVVETDVESAQSRAREADEAAANGELWGPLHGVPITLKDTWEFVGMHATAGTPMYKDHLPPTNADAVQRLLDAGAVVWGKTNTPPFAGDVQTYNEVYGTTSNPWNVEHTPGGSSGGSAAALAARFTPLELGSDIGGSIRTPAHYCGVYGHKPTLEIVPLRGHIPGPPGTLGGSDLAVAGPLANTATDLALALDIVAGPPASEPQGWDLALPAAGVDSLAGLKVGIWFDDPIAPIMGGMAAAFRALADGLSDAGAQVIEGSLAGYTLEEFIVPYLKMLAPDVSMGLPATVLDAMPQRAADALARYESGELLSKFLATQFGAATQTHMDYLRLHEKRNKMRQRVIAFFDDVDVMLTPVTIVTAPVHNNEAPMPDRRISVDGAEAAYMDQLHWIAPATMCGLPSTSAPIGMVDGLPTNTQIIGRPYADHTTIAVAALMEQAFGGAQTPPGF